MWQRVNLTNVIESTLKAMRVHPKHFLIQVCGSALLEKLLDTHREESALHMWQHGAADSHAVLMCV